MLVCVCGCAVTFEIHHRNVACDCVDLHLQGLGIVIGSTCAVSIIRYLFSSSFAFLPGMNFLSLTLEEQGWHYIYQVAVQIL